MGGGVVFQVTLRFRDDRSPPTSAGNVHDSTGFSRFGKELSILSWTEFKRRDSLVSAEQKNMSGFAHKLRRDIHRSPMANDEWER